MLLENGVLAVDYFEDALFDDTRQSPPKLHPGAAITFSIAAVIAVLSFIEVVFS